MWRYSIYRIHSDRCDECATNNVECRRCVEAALTAVGIEGKYSCTYSTLWKDKDWKSILKRDMTNVIIMKKIYVQESTDTIPRAVQHPEYVDKIYQFPLSTEYINYRYNEDDCINVIVCPG